MPMLKFLNLRGLLITLFTSAVLVCSFVTGAAAHESIGSVSNAILTVTGRTVNYYLNIPSVLADMLESVAQGDREWYLEYFEDSLRMYTWDKACMLTGMGPITPQPSGNRIFHLVYQCEKEIVDLTIKSGLFYNLDEKHMQFAKLAPADDPSQVLQEGIFTLKNYEFHIADVKTGGSVLLYRAYRFFILGIEHILSGYDHILFILSVIIITIKFMDSVKVVTSFTVAHSITLVLAFLGVISLPSSIVEPLIALTIVYVAFENVWFSKFSKRWMVTFVFGLIHGLGFVGVLKEITVSREELITSLFSFNAGIEVGQLLIVSVSIAALYYVRKQPWSRSFVRWCSAGMGVVGLLWFIERAFKVDFAALLVWAA